MYRYKLVIEYDGTDYAGWQYQPGLPTIQGSLQHAIAQVCQHEVHVQGSGRTDAGVHALGQVAHVDLKEPLDPYRLHRAVNFYLGAHPIRVLAVFQVPLDFHARFSSKKRRYIYRIIARDTPLVLEKNRAWYVYRPLSLEAMQAGATHLIGQHDFSTFRASECQAQSPVKTLDALEISQEGNLFLFRVQAPSFLHHQVRNMVGTLKLVGEGKWNPDDVATALAAKDRRRGGPTAAACGLYFHSVDYDDVHGL